MNIYEKRVIGGILAGLVTPGVLNLQAREFSDSDLGACLEILNQSERVDADLLAMRLGEQGGFYSADDFRLMAQAVPSATIAFEAADRLKASTLRKFLITKLASLAIDEEKTGSQLLDSVKDVISEADRKYRTTENNFVFLKDLAPKLKAVYDDLYRGVYFSVSTYFPTIDDQILDGFSKGDLHVIVGFTGQGKSALALNFARLQAQAGIPVGIVSREMSAMENCMRLQSSDSLIPRWKIRTNMSGDTHGALTDHLDRFSDIPIALDTKTSGMAPLRAQVAQMVEQYDLQILYVDYMQLMRGEEGFGSRAQEVGSISRDLKLIAMENNIPVVGLSQFNRAAWNATVFELLSCIKESSGIEQDSSTLIYVQIEQTEQPKQIREAKATVLKNRNGASFQPVKLNYHGEIFTFSEA